LNFGKLLIHTDENGVLFHMPKYMPGNSVAKTVIKGRNSEYFLVTGPFDDMNIIGDFFISNGKGIYPSGTENLFKFISKMTEEKKKIVYDLPFSLDLMLHFEENTHYVTYPLDLLVNEGSYLQVKFDYEKFLVEEASFISEEGSIDIFGTQMKADYVTVKVNPFEKRVRISGIFYQNAADGTLITLEISNMNITNGISGSNLQFDLKSDNPNDSRMDILALLRYGRRQEEISPSQKKTLLQDEVIQIAGLGIESAVLDPLISPVENWFRQFLRLDFFHLQTDLIQNIFSRYSSDNTDYVIDEEGERHSPSTVHLLLDDLSIGMGKYLSRKLFFDYAFSFQRSQDMAVETEMGSYHHLSLRYDLPYNFKVAIKYHILPFDEIDTQEIMLERSFRF
jgi:hypothetical protein